jgi:serine/threonine protein kinase
VAQEIAAVGALGMKRAVTIAAGVADVLAAAHARGIMHRDIKPDNIFLHREDDAEVVKVVDFGIATFFGDGENTAAQRLTRTGEYIGTPVYVAPERMAGGADDGRSDVFGLGAVLYEMLAGVPPWTKDEYVQMAVGVRERHPRPLHERRREVPAALEAMVAQTLAWDPAERPTACELAALMRDMAATLGDQPIAHAAHAGAESAELTQVGGRFD